jgi:hypothetical protein
MSVRVVSFALGLALGLTLLAASCHRERADRCESSRRALSARIDAARACRVDGDCVVSPFPCPFSCGVVLRGDAVPALQAAVSAYVDSCPRCKEDCAAWPLTAVCRDARCVGVTRRPGAR